MLPVAEASGPDIQVLAGQIMQGLTSGITGLAQGIGNGLNSMVTHGFITGTGSETELSAFGVVVVIFGGVSLAIGLTKFVTSFFTRGFGRS